MSRIVKALLLCSFAVAAAGQQQPNVEKGFQADKAYSFDGVDSINLFNGNLNLTVPIGISYPVSDTLRYSFALTYGGNSWAHTHRTVTVTEFPGTERERRVDKQQKWSEPTRLTNAGMGWLFSLGRLVHPDYTGELLNEDPNKFAIDASRWVYQSPDGAEHALYPHPHDPKVLPGAGTVTFYSRDQSYLRHTLLKNAQGALTGHLLEFPDGTMRDFAPDGTLTAIRDRFGSAVNITAGVSGAGAAVPIPSEAACGTSFSYWKIEDGHRTHYAYFRLTPLDPAMPKLAPYGERLCEVNLAAFDVNGAAAGESRAIYRFAYKDALISRQGISYEGEPAPADLISATVTVPLLTTLSQPDGSAYTLTYDIGSRNGTGLDTSSTSTPNELSYLSTAADLATTNPGKFSGHVTSLTLPTGGKYQWSYRSYSFPPSDRPPDEPPPLLQPRTYRSVSAGVAEKRVYTKHNGTGAADVWTYATSAIGDPDSGWQVAMKNSVTDPVGGVTDHYFSACQACPTAEYDPNEYGLPFARRTESGERGELEETGRFISSVTRGLTESRTSYVTYESDGVLPDLPSFDLNRRLQGSVTVVRDAAGAEIERFDVSYERFDGLGHYRDTIETAKKNGETQTRKTTTAYNTERGTYGTTGYSHVPTASQWILNTYDSVVSEAHPHVAAAFYCFDKTTGWLDRRRVVRRVDNPSTTTVDERKWDLLTIYTRGANGEKTVASYGGDLAPLPAAVTAYAATCTESAGAPQYTVTTWSTYGTPSSARHGAETFNDFDFTIDRSTGLVAASRDTRQRETNYLYDAMGRLNAVKPPHSAWSRYVYDMAASPRSVTATQHAAADSDGAISLTDAKFYYDGVGRLRQEKRRMPEKWATTDRMFDGLGRVEKTYVSRFAENGSFEDPPIGKFTKNDFDAFGRTSQITEADGSIVQFVHRGRREVSRTVAIAGAPAVDGATGSSFAATTREEYDGFGRLTKVIDPPPASSETTYSYDVGDRLVEVVMGAQERVFTYDGAGFLTEETHPEQSVPTTFEYDAKGHVRTQRTGSAVALEYVYNAAERLTHIRDLSKPRDLKLWEFNSVTGELDAQTRYNYAAIDGSAPTIRVRDAFLYHPQTGRLSRKTTTVTTESAAPVEHTFDQDFTYTELGAPDALNYPTCLSCPGLSLTKRGLALGYREGLLVGVAGATAAVGQSDGITYTASGAVARVTHANGAGGAGVVDTFMFDEGLQRLEQITLAAPACKLIETQPQNATAAPGEQVVLVLKPVSNGSLVQWYRGIGKDTPLAPTPSHPSLDVVAGSETVYYWASVTQANGGCTEDSLVVAVAVCVAPAISMPVPTTALEAVAGSVLDLVAEASGTSLSYTWEIRNASTQAVIDTRAGARATYPYPSGVTAIEIVLKVTNSCGTKSALVGKYRLTTAICSAVVLQPLDQLVVVPSPNVGYLLRFTLSEPSLKPVSYHFQWYEDGVEAKQELAVAWPSSTYHVTMRTADKIIRVRGWATCGTGTGATSSAKFESVAYTTVYGRCDIPPLAVSPASPVVAAGTSVALTASSVRPALTYQWYRGSRGDTRRPVTGATGATFMATAPSTYWVRATASCGSHVDSETVTVSTPSCQPVRFLATSGDTSVAAGERATLNILAAATPAPAKFQWYRSSGATDSSSVDRRVVVPDAPNGPTYDAAPLRTTDYWSLVSNQCGGELSPPMRVHVTSCADINVASQPRDVSASAGTFVELSIAASSSYPLKYQWYAGQSGDMSAPVTGATTYTLRVPADDRAYWVRVETTDPNRCAIDSPTVVAYGCKTPTITATNRTSQVPGQGQTLVAAVDTSRATFKWYLGETAVESARLWSDTEMLYVAPQTTTKFLVVAQTDCPGSTPSVASKVILVSVCPTNLPEPTAAGLSGPAPVAGEPRLVYIVRNNRATLSVGTIPSDYSVQWFSRPYGGSGETSVGTGASITTTAITQKTEFWARIRSGECTRDTSLIVVDLCTGVDAQWDPSSATKVTQGSQHSITVRAVTSQTPITFAIYEGSTSGDVANSVLLQTSSATYSSVFNQTRKFWARVSAPYGCYFDTPVHTVQVCVPQIDASPTGGLLDKTTNSAAYIPLSVVATPSNGPLTYQWYTGDTAPTTAITGAVSSTYQASPNVDTRYWVRVTGCGVSKDSTSALVTLCRPPSASTPGSIQSTANTSVTLGTTATGTNLTYKWYEKRSDGTSLQLGSTSDSVVVSPSVTTDYWVKVTGACGEVNTPTGKVSIPPVVSGPIGRKVTSGTSWPLTVTVSQGTQLSYEWQELKSGAWTTITSAVAATYTPPPVTADATFRCVVRSGSAATTSATATLTVCQPLPATVSGSGVSGTAHVLQVSGAQTGDTVEWYLGTSGSTQTRVGTGTSLTVSPTVSTNYWARTKRAECDADGATTQVRICVPRITTQPEGKTITPSTQHTMNVSATGPQPLSYQWFEGAAGVSTAPITGATSSSYTPPTTSTTKSYWVRVSSPLGAGCSTSSASSVTATITICNPPAITAEPQPQNVTSSSSSATLQVTATGDISAYQWYEGAVTDTSKPVGTNSRSLTIVAGSTKSYWVKVTGPCGTVSSRAVLVSVSPVITLSPTDAGICNLGETARFTMAATGADSYRWCRRLEGQTTWETLAETGATLTTAVSAVPTYIIGSAVSGNAITSADPVTVSLREKPGITSISRTYLYTGTFRLTVNVVHTETSSFIYRWYEGPVGTTTKLIGSTYYVTVTPSAPVTYWVRVTDEYTGCYTDKAYSF